MNKASHLGKPCCVMLVFAITLASGCRSSGSRTSQKPALPLSVYTDVSHLEENQRRAMRHLIRASRDLSHRSPSQEEFDACANFVRRAADLLAGSNSQKLATYLDHVEATLRNPKAEPSRELRQELPSDGPLLVVFHPTRQKTKTRPKTPPALEVALKDADEHRWIDVYLSRLAEFERSLPIRPDKRSVGDVPRDRIAIGHLVFRGGSLHDSLRITSRFPDSQGASPGEPRVFLFWKNLITRSWFETEVIKTAYVVLPEAHRALATARSLIHFYATRFSTYQLGPQIVATPDGDISLKDHFGETWGPLVIARADIVGFLAHEWLIDQGIQPEETSRENLAMLVTISFRALLDALTGAAPRAHAPASLVTINWLVEKGCLAKDPKTGCWNVDFEKAPDALKSLAETIFEIHAEGDQERATELLEKYGEPNEAIGATLQRLGIIDTPNLTPVWAVEGL